LLQDIPPRNIEHSQIILYHLQILEQLKENEKGLSLLETAERSNHILDVTSALEYRARLHTNLGNRREADQRWRELIDLNPDNIDYYKNFLKNHGIDLGGWWSNLSSEILIW
jgi:peptide alpha-N-acetyltransferase